MAPMKDGMTTHAHTPIAGTRSQPQLAHLSVHHAPRLGIIGAGQLARMTAMAAAQLGCEVVVLAASEDEPACALATRCVFGDRGGGKLAQLASQVDVVTLENEFVDGRRLEALKRQGVALFPSAHCVSLVQDKFVQKSLLAAHDIAMSRVRAVGCRAKIEKAAEDQLSAGLKGASYRL